MFEYNFTQEIDLSLRSMAWFVTSTAKSWAEAVRGLRARIDDQGVIEVDHIYSEVKDQVGRVFVANESPDEATIRIYGVNVHKKILHMKSEEYNGADLLIEVEGEKFALIQFKKQNVRNRYEFDDDQLDNLGTFCKHCIQDEYVPPPCSSYIWLIDDSRYYTKHRVLKLCQIKKILNSRKSAHKSEFYNNGIYRSTFKELFVKCWEGAPYSRKVTEEDLDSYLTKTKRIIVNYIFGRDISPVRNSF